MPNHVNNVTMIGNLTRDPELREVNDTFVCDFGLAINNEYSQNDETCFVDVTAWGRQAQNCDEYLESGDPIYLEGRLKYEKWDSDGKTHSRHKIVASTVNFLHGGNGEAEPDEFLDDVEMDEEGGENESIPF